ncbi:hypothetical protein HanIR_Chr12g0577091 [Helianthus annuus]|nr:hypothetical protein HanIR_Chr12g0577091 [Helianthus annuus]
MPSALIGALGNGQNIHQEPSCSVSRYYQHYFRNCKQTGLNTWSLDVLDWNLQSGIAGVVMGQLEGAMCLKFNFGLLFASAEHVVFI